MVLENASALSGIANKADKRLSATKQI